MIASNYLFDTEPIAFATAVSGMDTQGADHQYALQEWVLRIAPVPRKPNWYQIGTRMNSHDLLLQYEHVRVVNLWKQQRK